MTITTAYAGRETAKALLYEAKCDRCGTVLLVTPSRRTLLEMLGIYRPGWQTGEPIVCTACCQQRVDATKESLDRSITGGRERRYNDAKKALKRARKAERYAKRENERENGSNKHE